MRFTFFGITILREGSTVDTIARLSMEALHTMGKPEFSRSFQDYSSESAGTAHGWVGTLPCPCMFLSVCLGVHARVARASLSALVLVSLSMLIIDEMTLG